MCANGEDDGGGKRGKAKREEKEDANEESEAIGPSNRSEELGWEEAAMNDTSPLPLRSIRIRSAQTQKNAQNAFPPVAEGESMHIGPVSRLTAYKRAGGVRYTTAIYCNGSPSLFPLHALGRPLSSPACLHACLPACPLASLASPPSWPRATATRPLRAWLQSRQHSPRQHRACQELIGLAWKMLEKGLMAG